MPSAPTWAGPSGTAGRWRGARSDRSAGWPALRCSTMGKQSAVQANVPTTRQRPSRRGGGAVALCATTGRACDGPARDLLGVGLDQALDELVDRAGLRQVALAGL